MTKNVCQFLVLVTVLCVTACSNKPSDSSNLPAIIITPHMEANIIEGRNIVYCSTFQIAWNMLQDEILMEKILLEGRPAIADLLNKQLNSKKDISELSYVAMGGELTDDFLKQLNKSLREKFGNEAPPAVTAPPGTAVLIYAFLYKNLLFNKEFEKLYEPIKFHAHGSQTSLRGFGINRAPYSKDVAHLRKQVTVFDYKADDNFIIGLSSKWADDEIILAKTTPDQTLLETILKVDGRIRNAMASSFLEENEPLQIPVIEIDTVHSFGELKGKRIENGGKLHGYYISAALQSIKFRLNETGALLKSEAIERIAAAPNTGKRTFIFDKPFLIYLKQKNAKYPYFAMWVENTSILVSHESRRNLEGLKKAITGLIGADNK